MKQESSAFTDLSKVSVAYLLRRLRKYELKDPIGHPLESIYEFREIVRRLKEMEKGKR